MGAAHGGQWMPHKNGRTVRRLGDLAAVAAETQKKGGAAEEAGWWW